MCNNWQYCISGNFDEVKSLTNFGQIVKLNYYILWWLIRMNLTNQYTQGHSQGWACAHPTFVPRLLKDQYTLIEQSNILIKQSQALPTFNSDAMMPSNLSKFISTKLLMWGFVKASCCMVSKSINFISNSLSFHQNVVRICQMISVSVLHML